MSHLRVFSEEPSGNPLVSFFDADAQYGVKSDVTVKGTFSFKDLPDLKGTISLGNDATNPKISNIPTWKIFSKNDDASGEDDEESLVAFGKWKLLKNGYIQFIGIETAPALTAFGTQVEYIGKLKLKAKYTTIKSEEVNFDGKIFYRNNLLDKRGIGLGFVMPRELADQLPEDFTLSGEGLISSIDSSTIEVMGKSYKFILNLLNSLDPGNKCWDIPTKTTVANSLSTSFALNNQGYNEFLDGVKKAFNFE